MTEDRDTQEIVRETLTAWVRQGQGGKGQDLSFLPAPLALRGCKGSGRAQGEATAMGKAKHSLQRSRTSCHPHRSSLRSPTSEGGDGIQWAGFVSTTAPSREMGKDGTRQGGKTSSPWVVGPWLEDSIAHRVSHMQITTGTKIAIISAMHALQDIDLNSSWILGSNSEPWQPMDGPRFLLIGDVRSKAVTARS